MSLRRTLSVLSVALLGAALACQSGSPETSPPASQAPAEAAPAFSGFAPNAFPPTLVGAEFHGEAWTRTDCLLCHEAGRDGAPVVEHEGMSPLLLESKCRTCHVPEPAGDFIYNAFPPTLPDDDSHADAWLRDDCLLCHETGTNDAPIVRHADMSPELLKARCRTCHVMIPGSAGPGE